VETISLSTARAGPGIHVRVKVNELAAEPRPWPKAHRRGLRGGV